MKKRLFFCAQTFYLAIVIFFSFVAKMHSQVSGTSPSMEIYGYIMTDIGYNFDQIQEDWYDVVRPTKLPSFENQYGTNGNMYFSVRQTRLGFKNYIDTSMGEVKTHFDFDLFGTGLNAGQTIFRFRSAYAEIGQFGVGQTDSPFMDGDVFPNILEYWGPSGMVGFRNVQIRFMPIQGNTRLTIALERPGASADQGIYTDRIELDGVNPRFSFPDLSAEYRHGTPWGYVEIAGIVRRIEWVDQNDDEFDLSGDAVGWGLSLSTNLKVGAKDVFRGQFVYGEGIENYMNDAPVDIGIKTNFSNPASPVKGIALPVLGIVAFLDHSWNEKFSSSLGYSMINIENSDGQTDDAFHKGQYIAGNLLYYPAKNVMAGVEFQWSNRENFNDGWETSMSKIQFSFKYNFSEIFYKKQ